MKLRLIIVVLSLAAFLTASGGGYFYYYTTKNNTLQEIDKDTDKSIKELASRIELSLSPYQRMTAVIAGMNEVKNALASEQPSAISRANSSLDLFQHTLAVDACYLIDRSGKTIASSNRNAPDSFINQNYSFRPYFQEAMSGRPGVYMALGVTSGKRGVYYSQPVYLQSSSNPVGVAVIKASVNYIEQEINASYEGIMLLADHHGVIFVSNRPDWLYHVLWKTSPDVLATVAASHQFGKDPIVWTGVEQKNKDKAVDPSGNEYIIHRVPFLNYPGWEIIYLHPLRIIDLQIAGMMFKNMVLIIVAICVIIGFMSIFLYRKASLEIIKRKRVEERLTSISDRLQAVIDASPLPITIIDVNSKVLQWNPAAEQTFGWSEADVIGRPLPIIPGDRQEEGIEFRKNIFQGKSFKTVETVRVRKDGTQVHVSLSASPLLDTRGTVIAAMGIYEDITERRKAEEDVRFLASIIQNLPDAVCAIDTSGKTMVWNKGAEAMLGYKAEEMIGKPITDVIPEEIAQQELAHCLTALNAYGFFTGYESVRRAKDGKKIPVELTAVAIRDSSKKIKNYASVMLDITNRKKAEEQRIRSHTLESIGILAGGIAHDFNNLLGIILGDIQIAKMTANPDDKSFRRLSDAEEVCEKASELSERLITFATGGEPLRRVTSIVELITETVPEVLRYSPAISNFDFPDDLHAVAIDEGQMKQVITNLTMNAAEAMMDGGTLNVQGQNVHVTEKDHLPLQAGDYVKISFHDTGVGIPAENIPRIFEPYFSTKDTYSQKGLGLGLAVCYSVVKRHNGLITVESTVGKGSTFHIYLPASNSKQ